MNLHQCFSQLTLTCQFLNCLGRAFSFSETQSPIRTPDAARNRTNDWLLDAGMCAQAKELDSVSPCSASPLSAAATSPAGSSRLGYDSESDVLDLFTVDGHSALAASPAVGRRERSRLHRASVAETAPIAAADVLQVVASQGRGGDLSPAAIGESVPAMPPSGTSHHGSSPDSIEPRDAVPQAADVAFMPPLGDGFGEVPPRITVEPHRTGVTPVRLAWGSPECSPQKLADPVGDADIDPSRTLEAEEGTPAHELPKSASPADLMLLDLDSAQRWDGDRWSEEPPEAGVALEGRRASFELPAGEALERPAAQEKPCEPPLDSRGEGSIQHAEGGDRGMSGSGMARSALGQQLPGQLRRLPLGGLPLGGFENFEPNSSERGSGPSSPSQRSAPLQVHMGLMQGLGSPCKPDSASNPLNEGERQGQAAEDLVRGLGENWGAGLDNEVDAVGDPSAPRRALSARRRLDLSGK